MEALPKGSATPVNIQEAESNSSKVQEKQKQQQKQKKIHKRSMHVKIPTTSSEGLSQTKI
jgi:hypothetical protein